MCKHWNETKRGHVQLEYIINNKKNDKIYKKIHFLALSANLNIFCIFLFKMFLYARLSIRLHSNLWLTLIYNLINSLSNKLCNLVQYPTLFNNLLLIAISVSYSIPLNLDFKTFNF